MFAPEIQVLRYEILREKGLWEQAAQTKKAVLEQYPGLKFRFEFADDDFGILNVNWRKKWQRNPYGGLRPQPK